MKYVVLTLMLVASAANAQSDGTGEPTRPTPAAYASPGQPAPLVLQPSVCDSADAPLKWLDASDALTFAANPLAQLTNDDAAFLRLGSLLQLRVTAGSLRLFVLGASWTTRAHLQFVSPEAGWRVSSC